MLKVEPVKKPRDLREERVREQGILAMGWTTARRQRPVLAWRWVEEGSGACSLRGRKGEREPLSPSSSPSGQERSLARPLTPNTLPGTMTCYSVQEADTKETQRREGHFASEH